MYCGKCGKEIDNDSEFCSFCGEKIRTRLRMEPSNPLTSVPKKQINVKSQKVIVGTHKKNIWRILLGVSALVILVCACFVILNLIDSNSYEKPIATFMEGLSRRDNDAIDKIVAPDCMGEINARLNLNMALSAGYDWDYDIGHISKLDKYELADMVDTYLFEYSNLKVSNGYSISLAVAAYDQQDSNSLAYTDTWEFTVAKINGIQYIISLECNERFSDYDEQANSADNSNSITSGSEQGETTSSDRSHASLTLDLPVGTVLNGYLAAGTQYTAVLNSDGTVTCYGGEGSGIDTKSWENIVAISGYDDHVVGLRSNGTLVGTGETEEDCRDFEGWMGIVQIATGYHSTVALTKDGYVKYTGTHNYGMNNCVNWENIRTLATGDDHMVGILEDGTMAASGYNSSGQCEVAGFKDVMCAAVGCQYTFIVHEDGTVDVVGGNDDYAYGQTDATSWGNIIAIDSGDEHVIGLTKDGRVLAAGDNSYGQCNVDKWTNIVAICAGRYHTVAIDCKGNLYMTGDNQYGQCMGNGD